MRHRLAVLCALLLAAFRLRLRVVGVVACVLLVVMATTSTRADWFAVVVGVGLGLVLGLPICFGDMWADAEERREQQSDPTRPLARRQPPP